MNQDLVNKYEGNEFVGETAEQFNTLSKEMSNIKLSDAGKAGEMVKDATKELGLMDSDSLVKRLPVIGKIAKRAENKLIDTMTAEQVLTRYEKELMEEETKAKITKEDIKNGIQKNKEIVNQVESKIQELEGDIKMLQDEEAKGNKIVEDVPGTTLNRMNSYLVTMQQQKADAVSRTLQYGVQLVLAENILTGFNDVRLSVTTTLRDSIQQAQIIKQQEDYIKSIGDAKELIRGVKEDNAERLQQMTKNAAGDIYQYEKDAASLKKITDINYATINNIQELNTAISKGRELLKDTFIEIEDSAKKQEDLFKTITAKASSASDDEKQKLIEEAKVD